MSFASLVLGQIPGGGGFLLGTAGELEGLFGRPLPELPPGETGEGGVERLAVETHQPLRDAFSRWLDAILPRIDAGAPPPGSPETAAEREYHDLLAETCRGIQLADRRQGLYNLFWLAHGREIAEGVEQRFTGGGRRPQLRYQIHPLLSGILERAERDSRIGLSRSQRLLLDLRRGNPWNDSLIRCLVEDQLPLTERDPGAFDPARVLVPANRRFRVSAAAYGEISRVLRERLIRGLDRGERGLAQVLRSAAPSVQPEDCADPRVLVRLLHADAVREYLLLDLDGTVEELRRSRVLQQERGGGGGWCELLSGFTEVSRCVRRAEAVGALRRALECTGPDLGCQETRERYLEGRLFRLSAADAVQSSLRTATILIGDIRGFTRASEGPVSEGNLARELYEIFDPAALVVRRFRGTVDKYLGDGFLATFAAGIRPAGETLAAVRAAVAIQEILGGLRRQGRTAFRMGLSLHLGRVAVARFLRDERGVDTTLIGRQMNIAARLAASGDAPEGEAAKNGAAGRTVGGVSITASGVVDNHGIAVSGSLFKVLLEQLPLEEFREPGAEGHRCYDPELGLWLHFGYVGEARFRGIEATAPVYSLVAAAPETGR